MKKKYNKTTFWDNTKGVFKIKVEGDFFDLISLAINTYFKIDGFEANFNKKNDTFYIRTNLFAVRISNKWGSVGNCNWTLERDRNEEKYQMVEINYDELEPF